MASKTILMTNGVQTVPVVRSAFVRTWSRLGWSVAAPDAVETERILNLEEGETIEEWQAREDERLAEIAKIDEAQVEALKQLDEYDKAVAEGTSADDVAGSTAVTASEQAPPSQAPAGSGSSKTSTSTKGDSTPGGDSGTSNPPAAS